MMKVKEIRLSELGIQLTSSGSSLTLVRDETGESPKPGFYISCLIISIIV